MVSPLASTAQFCDWALWLRPGHLQICKLAAAKGIRQMQTCCRSFGAPECGLRKGA